MAVNPVKTTFTNMSWTPDVPSSALGAQEYNEGLNVETDTRGVKSVLGDELILSQLTGKPIFVTGGYRSNDVWWYIIGCVGTAGAGHWYAMNTAGITEITPPGGLTGYYDGMPITDAWNGDVLFLNDSVDAKSKIEVYLPTNLDITLYAASDTQQLLKTSFVFDSYIKLTDGTIYQYTLTGNITFNAVANAVTAAPEPYVS